MSADGRPAVFKTVCGPSMDVHSDPRGSARVHVSRPVTANDSQDLALGPCLPGVGSNSAGTVRQPSRGLLNRLGIGKSKLPRHLKSDNPALRHTRASSSPFRTRAAHQLSGLGLRRPELDSALTDFV
jgi:hypothetical protein